MSVVVASPEDIAAVRERIKEFKGFQTRRLTLRPLTFDDVNHLTNLLADARVSGWIYLFEQPFTTASAYKWINRGYELQEKGDGFHMGAWYTGSNVMVGELGLMADPDTLTGEFGGSLGTPFWGQRFADEAVVAFLENAFETLGLRKMQATTALDNRSSKRVMESLGFVHAGQKVVKTWAGGDRPSDFYAMTYGLWREVRGKLQAQSNSET